MKKLISLALLCAVIVVSVWAVKSFTPVYYGSATKAFNAKAATVYYSYLPTSGATLLPDSLYAYTDLDSATYVSTGATTVRFLYRLFDFNDDNLTDTIWASGWTTGTSTAAPVGVFSTNGCWINNPGDAFRCIAWKCSVLTPNADSMPCNVYFGGSSQY
jgi:hypothetical protein